MLNSIGEDLRYAFRVIRLEPAFALVAIFSLALGAGANTTIFHCSTPLACKRFPSGRRTNSSSFNSMT
jgi:hypothetical protein